MTAPSAPPAPPDALPPFPSLFGFSSHVGPFITQGRKPRTRKMLALWAHTTRGRPVPTDGTAGSRRGEQQAKDDFKQLG